jgi:aminopeptidase N
MRQFLGVLLLGASTLHAQGIPTRKDRLVDTLHTYQPGIDVLHYDFTVDLPVEGDTILGVAAITVLKRPSVGELRLDLLSARVDSVHVNGLPARFHRDSATIRVPLSRDSSVVTVRYRAAPRDGLIIRTDSTGRRTFFGDNWPNRARHWLPVVDHPSDKATVTWRIGVPPGMTSISNGLRSEEGGRHLWRLARPIPTYLMVIGVARMTETPLGETACGFSEVAHCVVQSVYTFPEDASFIPGPFAKAGPIVELFSRRFGIFPYEKLAHVQSSTRFGGMENASAIFYSDAAFRRRSLRVGLIAHEAAHQWFGNSATAREWAHLWLSEGFATYLEQLWHEHDLGRDSLRAGMRRIRDQILRAREVAERPVIDSAQRDLMALLNTNSYQKGGFVLHMLRAAVGDSAFFRALRSYYAAHRHGTALTSDFERHVEQAAGRSMKWFFDQWLRRPGYPTLSLRWVYDPERKAIAFKAEQSGPHGYFRVLLPIEIHDGQQVRRLELDIPARAETRQWLEVPLQRAPERVTIDPDVQVLGVITTKAL